MANVATPIEVRQWALCKEGTRGTAETVPASFLSLTKDSDIDFALKLIEDPALRGYNTKFASFPGILEAKGSMKSPFRAQNHGEFLHMLLGAVTASTNQTYKTVVASTNDYIDCTIAGGSELHAQIAPGAYPLGASSATNGSYLKAIKTALDAVGGGTTFTITLSSNNIVVTASTGVFVIKFGTGTNIAKSAAADMGFAAADTASAIAATGTLGNVLDPYKHTFTQGQVTQLPAYTFFADRGAFSGGAKAIKQYNLGCLQKLKLSAGQETPVEMEAHMLAQREAAFPGTWTPLYSESPVLMFSQSTTKFAGSAPSVPNVKSWEVDLDPGVVEFRPQSQQQYCQDILAKGPFAASGSMVVYFMDLVSRAKFLAATPEAIEHIVTGTAIGASAQTYALEMNFPVSEYQAYAFGDEDGFLGAKVKWAARGSFSSGTFVPAMTAYLYNTKTSY